MRRPPIVLAAAWLAASAVCALPPVVVERHVVLSVEALLVEGSESRREGDPVSIEVGPDGEEKTGLTVPWGPQGAIAAVRLTARLSPSPGDDAPLVRCTAQVEVAGRPVRISDRVIEGEGTALFEVFDEGNRRIVLALRTEPLDRAVVRRFAKVGDPVRFLVAVERVDGDRAVLLETNHLNTFVGQSVGYSFRLGHDESREELRLDLLPLSVSGDIVTIQAGISGALPGAGVTTLLSRQERIVASRMSTSAISATAGTPPSGYRFQVTPDF